MSKINNTDESLKVRDREATRERLIKSVGTLLASGGFRALGVNAVSREAGVDKVLIYRYFGGLPELIKAYGRSVDFWPSVNELAGGDPEQFSRLSIEDRLMRMAENYLHAIRNRPLTLEILAWEMVDRNELTIELETIRENRILRFFQLYFPSMGEEQDLQAAAAIIGGAISYLAARSRTARWYSGIDLQSDKGWERLANTIQQIIRNFVS